MKDDLKQRAVRGGLWFGGSRWAIQGLTWIATIFVARILTPADYGLFGFAMLVTGLIDLINELGLGAAIVQKRDLNAKALETVFWFSMACSVVVYGLVWLVAPWIAVFFGQPQLIPVLRVITLTFPIGSLRIIPWNLLTKRVDFKHRSLAEVGANVVSSLILLALAYAGYGVWSLVASTLCKQILTTLFCFVLQPWRPRGHFGFAILRQLYGFGLNVSAGRVTWYLYSNSDFLIVGKLLGQQMLGLYTMVFQLATMPLDRIMSVINQVAFPIYAELQTEPERLKRYFLKVATLVSLIIFPILAGAFLVVDLAVPLLLTAKWTPIVIPLKIMCPVAICMSVSYITSPAVLAMGRPDLSLKFNLICLVLLPIGFVVGTRFGIVGVCWAWLIMYPGITTGYYFAVRKLLGFEWTEFLRALAPATLGTVVMLAGGFLVRWAISEISANLLKLLLLIGTGATGYFTILTWRFRPELLEFKQLLQKAPQVTSAPSGGVTMVSES